LVFEGSTVAAGPAGSTVAAGLVGSTVAAARLRSIVPVGIDLEVSLGAIVSTVLLCLRSGSLAGGADGFCRRPFDLRHDNTFQLLRACASGTIQQTRRESPNGLTIVPSPCSGRERI